MRQLMKTSVELVRTAMTPRSRYSIMWVAARDVHARPIAKATVNTAHVRSEILMKVEAGLKSRRSDDESREEPGRGQGKFDDEGFGVGSFRFEDRCDSSRGPADEIARDLDFRLESHR